MCVTFNVPVRAATILQLVPVGTAKNGVKYGKYEFPSISANGKIDGH